ncbi:L-histidine N(alpha)-methyltransferase [Kangiella sp. HZ709]|uniref:L-histidine N(alpha)-methyltransferase n=1 Tax=Kangiella sp. HZ709 TaxID=2666328 RepID=UPI0012B0671C|nr:L-histidine N(alpha)-methyltransferase [Kangiella sp. HZ709]MRX26614.1 L-histidine N(alpha)-methyltransferase [Kangiella sp. HZ709]
MKTTELELNLEELELLNGLTKKQKSLNPKYFYDKKGSQLFEKITAVEEYYPTRTEIEILKNNTAEIASYLGQGIVLIEPGAGNCSKVRLILDELKPKAFFPQDVSRRFLNQAADELKQDFPWLNVQPIVSDFSKPIVLPENMANEPKFVFYPGSTIGNFEPENAIKFLKNMRKLVGDDGGILIGMDLHKAKSILEPAYNDSRQITAAFNLNMLFNLNEKFNADFDISEFSHRAFYNDSLRRIEMHLISNSPQTVRLLGQTIRFEQSETIHTENSYKFTEEDIINMANKSGFKLIKSWFDKDRLFSVNYFKSIND